MSRTILVASFSVLSSPAFAVSALDRAEASGVCGVNGVASATLNDDNVVVAQCNTDGATVSLFSGGLVASLAGGGPAAAAVALAATTTGASTSDTQ